MPNIEENIILRSPEPKDAKLIYKWENDDEISRFGNNQTLLSLYAIEIFIKEHNFDIYTSKQQRFMVDLISDSNPPRTIGTIDLFDFDPKNLRAAVGILIKEEYRNNGYADLSIDKIIDFSKKRLNLNQLYCYVNTSNTPSLNLFKKKGFEECGYLKKWNLINSEWNDTVMFQRFI